MHKYSLNEKEEIYLIIKHI